jgi:hypothetical protein
LALRSIVLYMTTNAMHAGPARRWVLMEGRRLQVPPPHFKTQVRPSFSSYPSRLGFSHACHLAASFHTSFKPQRLRHHGTSIPKPHSLPCRCMPHDSLCAGDRKGAFKSNRFCLATNVMYNHERGRQGDIKKECLHHFFGPQ